MTRLFGLGLLLALFLMALPAEAATHHWTGLREFPCQARGQGPNWAFDGLYGPTTTDVVRSFQQAHGLRVDGLTGRHTRAALGLPAGRLLRCGKGGNDVLRLQERLAALGFWGGQAERKAVRLAPRPRPVAAPTAHPTAMPTAKPTVRPTAKPVVQRPAVHLSARSLPTAPSRPAPRPTPRPAARPTPPPPPESLPIPMPLDPLDAIPTEAPPTSAPPTEAPQQEGPEAEPTPLDESTHALPTLELGGGAWLLNQGGAFYRPNGTSNFDVATLSPSWIGDASLWYGQVGVGLAVTTFALDPAVSPDLLGAQAYDGLLKWRTGDGRLQLFGGYRGHTAGNGLQFGELGASVEQPLSGDWLLLDAKLGGGYALNGSTYVDGSAGLGLRFRPLTVGLGFRHLSLYPNGSTEAHVNGPVAEVHVGF